MTKHEVVVRTGFGHGLFKVDADIVTRTDTLLQLLHLERVEFYLSIGNLLLELEYLVGCQAAQEACSFGISKLFQATRFGNKVADAFILLCERIESCIHHLTLYFDILLVVERGTAADIYLVIGFEEEGAVAVDLQVLGQLKGKELCTHFALLVGGSGVLDLSGDINSHSGSRFEQTTGLEYKIFDGLVVGIFVGARIEDLTIHLDGTFLESFFVAGDVEDIFAFKRHIRHTSFENSSDIDWHQTVCAVGIHTVHQCVVSHGCFGETVSCFDDLTDGVDFVTNMEDSGTEGCSTYFDDVLETILVLIDCEFVTILKEESAGFGCLDVVGGTSLAVGTHDADGISVGVGSKATAIFQQVLHGFSFLHLVTHRTLHGAVCLHDIDIRTDDNHVVVAQPDVARQFTIENVVVDIDSR